MTYKENGMSTVNITLEQSTELNRILFENLMRKGTLKVIPKDEFHFINNLNGDNTFKLPDVMKSVETRKSFTHRDTRVTKVFWIMDLTDGKRLLSYANPSSIKILHNNKLIKEEVTSDSKLLVPSNVETLWRLDATYIIENDVEVYDKADIRQYSKK